MVKKINTGDRVKDPISGFQGIVTCRLEYLNGCVRLAVSPEKLVDGKVVDAFYFDEPQVTLIKSKVYTGIVDTGGFKDAPPSRSVDRR